MRLLWLVAFSFLVGGCLEVDSLDGSLICSKVPDRKCPMGYYCAANNTCWRNGHGYDMTLGRDLSWSFPLPDFSDSRDLSSPTD